MISHVVSSFPSIGRSGQACCWFRSLFLLWALLSRLGPVGNLGPGLYTGKGNCLYHKAGDATRSALLRPHGRSSHNVKCGKQCCETTATAEILLQGPA
jgi:hypothetical protein